jgi:hypothetical protein
VPQGSTPLSINPDTANASACRIWVTLLQILGVIAIALGALNIAGNLMIADDPDHHLARTTSQMSSQERVMQDAKDRSQAGSFFVLMAGVGVLSIIVGTLIQAIFPQTGLRSSHCLANAWRLACILPQVLAKE